MGYKLKPQYEAFETVDGPFAGRIYRQGNVYDEIPPEEAYKFDEMEEGTIREKPAQPELLTRRTARTARVEMKHNSTQEEQEGGE